MFRFWRKKRKNEDVGQAAYESGRQFGAYVGEFLERIVRVEIAQRRERFLMVLEDRLTGIKVIEDASYEMHARVELKVMLDNWNERRSEQCEELWAAIEAQVDKEPFEILGRAEVDDLIQVLLDRESGLLMSEGIERTAEAIERYKSQ